MENESETTGGLHRKTNWWGAFVIGLAGTLLVTGIAPFAIAGMGAAAFRSSSWSRRPAWCLFLPGRVGRHDAPSHRRNAFLRLRNVQRLRPQCRPTGRRFLRVGLCIGWFPVAPINMILAAKYIAELFAIPPGVTFTPISAPITSTEVIISIVGLLVLFVPCYLGIHLGARFATILGVISMVPITLLVFLPFFKPETLHWSNLAGFAARAGQSRLHVLHQLGLYHQLVGARDGGLRLLHRRVPQPGPRRENRDDRLRPVRPVHLRFCR